MVHMYKTHDSNTFLPMWIGSVWECKGETFNTPKCIPIVGIRKTPIKFLDFWGKDLGFPNWMIFKSLESYLKGLK
jgi:hypothetical protein